MISVQEKVLSYTAKLPEGAIINTKSLLQFGERPAVDQALSRLKRQGLLLRIARGSYVRPIKGKFGVRPPAPEKVVEAITGNGSEVVASNGASAANSLGLSTQVPARAVFVTTGRSRTFMLGKQSVELQHVPNWQLALASRPAGAAVRALAWLGKVHASEAVGKLRQTLPPLEWEALYAVRPKLPGWLASAVSQAAPHA